MEEFDPKALDNFLKNQGVNISDTSDDILQVLPPKRRYLGPAEWYEFVQKNPEPKND